MRNALRALRRSERDPQRMKAGTEAMLVAAAMMPTSPRLAPRAYANRGISGDVAPPAMPCGR